MYQTDTYQTDACQTDACQTDPDQTHPDQIDLDQSDRLPSDAELELKIPLPPTEDELLYDDDIPMETHRHKLQMDLLVDPLIPWLLVDRQRGFVGGNMFVYFSPSQLKTQDYRGPDVFVVLDVPIRDRKCWVVWDEGKAPDVVIELLSPSTMQKDKTEKKLIYQNQLRVPDTSGTTRLTPTIWLDLACDRAFTSRSPWTSRVA